MVGSQTLGLLGREIHKVTSLTYWYGPVFPCSHLPIINILQQFMLECIEKLALLPQALPLLFSLFHAQGFIGPGYVQ